MKIQLCQFEIAPGHPAKNAKKMLETIEKAKSEKVDLLIFSELCVPGYLIGDLWEMPDFLNDCVYWGEKIRESTKDISVIFGNIALDPTKINEDGRIRKYNALFFAENQTFLRPNNFCYPFTIKSLLPNYREFDDSRYFYGMHQLANELNKSVIELINPFYSRHGVIAGVLCEDGWDTDYTTSPIKILSNKNIELIVNISCSPFTLNKNDKRNRTFGAQAKKYNKPLIYVNNVGIQNNGKTIYTFDGQSTIYTPSGEIETLLPAFAEQTKTFEWSNKKNILISKTLSQTSETEQVFQSLKYGTQAFMKQLGIQKVVIGLSGGIDSAVAAALYATILKPENLLLVNMPSKYNAELTKNLARDIAKNIGCLFTEIPISESILLTKNQLDNLEINSFDKNIKYKVKLESFVLENIQARDRSGRILAAIAAAFNGVFTSNANKSETTVGYSTLYGDHAGFLANLADLWKYQVYELGKYLNNDVFKKEIIPEGVFTVKPSAELSEKQDVTKGLGDPIIYEYHDLLFKSWVEKWARATPETILTWYLNKTIEKELQLKKPISEYFSNANEFIADLEKWWNLYQGMAIAKRIQAPPILAVSRRAFGFDHRESQCGAYYTAKYQELKNQILKQ